MNLNGREHGGSRSKKVELRQRDGDVAVFIALGGVGYAATQLPKNSVGAKQLRKNAVTGAKVKNGSLRKADFGAGQLPTGATGPPAPRSWQQR